MLMDSGVDDIGSSKLLNMGGLCLKFSTFKSWNIFKILSSLMVGCGLGGDCALDGFWWNGIFSIVVLSLKVYSRKEG